MNPWLLLGAVLFWIASMGAAYYKGHHDGTLDVQTKWNKAIEQQRLKEEKQIGDAAKKKESGDAKAKIVYRTITQNVDRVVEKPVYRNVCLDDAGLLLANQALSGSLAAPGKPDKPMPRPSTPGGRNGGVSVAETR